jgi:hypothetical protein
MVGADEIARGCSRGVYVRAGAENGQAHRSDQVEVEVKVKVKPNRVSLATLTSA